MALSRLSVAEITLLLQAKGDPIRLLKPTRRWCSSPASTSISKKKRTPSKKAEAAKEQRMIAVESVVKKYMEMNPGVFPKATQVHEEVGGSWYTVKDILTALKERMTVDAQNQMTLNGQIQTETTSGKGDITVTLDRHIQMEATDVQDVTVALNTQIQMETTSGKDVIVEAALKATTLEENPDSAAPKDTVQLAEAINDHVNQKSMICEKSLIGSEKSSTAVVTAEYSDNANLVDVQGGDRQLAKNPIKAEQHERGQKEAEQTLTRMISRILSEEDERESPNGLALDDAESNKGTLVENGDRLPERNMTSSTLEWKSVASNSPVLNRQRSSSLVNLFKHHQTAVRADGEMGMVNATSKNVRFSDVKIATAAADDDVKENITSMFNLVKGFAKLPSRNPILEKHNGRSGGPRSENSRSIMPESPRLLKADEEQNIRGGPNICNEIEKPEQKKKQVEPKETNCLNSIVEEDKSSCGGMNQLDKEEEPMKVPFDMYDSQFVSEDESGSESDCAAFDYPTSESKTRILPTQPASKALNPDIFLYTEKGREQNYVMVKFVQKSATEDNLRVAFAFCGPIAKISMIPSRKEKWFNYAYVYFKTEEGMRKALSRTDTVVGGADVVVEGTFPLLKMPKRICAPDPIGDPSVPKALLKNPTRTLMIKGLCQDVAFHNLRRALSSFGRISGFSMGSSSDIAYVEFETEDAKEKALAAYSVSILGRQLTLLRIDIPRTTVVRISNVAETANAKIHDTCASHGQIKRLVRRGVETADVHFKLIEWANMVKILNSLNGMVVDGNHWIAQPGTVLPAEILEALWREPDGRGYVHSLMQKLCRKIQGGSVDTSDITGLIAEYLREKAI